MNKNILNTDLGLSYARAIADKYHTSFGETYKRMNSYEAQTRTKENNKAIKHYIETDDRTLMDIIMKSSYWMGSAGKVVKDAKDLGLLLGTYAWGG